MASIIREETHKYKNRVFKIVVLEDSWGFNVHTLDEAGKKVDHGKCSHENYTIIREKDISKDPVAEIIEVQKKTIDLWVDKGLA